jgi:hypothetical protein
VKRIHAAGVGFARISSIRLSRDPNVANRARPVLTQLLSSPLIAAGPRQLPNIFCAHSVFWGKRLSHVFISASGEKRSISSDILFSNFVIIAACIGSWKAKKLPCLRWRAVNFNSDLHDYSTPRWPSPITSAVVRCPPMTCRTAASTSTRCGTSRFTQQMVR